MPQQIFVHLLPQLVAEAELAGGAVVVLDVLRASTTIIHALAASASGVVPCVDIDEARSVASALPAGNAVLGGERGGLRIDGFQLGNSPAEYTPETVGGRTVVITTTNGTRALARARQAAEVLIGAPVNAAAIVRRLRERDRVHLLCAGTAGRIAREDVLGAGLLAARLVEANPQGELANDEARLAVAVWRSAALAHAGNALLGEWLAAELSDSAGGRNLSQLGLAADIADAARVDRFDLVPALDIERWIIERA